MLAAGAIPYEIVNHVDLAPRDLLPVPGSIWTSMFLHGGWMHLIGNMWFLWLFGDNVEEALGSLRYLLFYFLVGTVGALTQSYSLPSSTAPMIGASGAVAGVLGGYVMLYPRARIVSIVFRSCGSSTCRPGSSSGSGSSGSSCSRRGSGVAWMAHVGGFLAGLGSVRLLAALAPRARPRARSRSSTCRRAAAWRGGNANALDSDGVTRKIAGRSSAVFSRGEARRLSSAG